MNSWILKPIWTIFRDYFATLEVVCEKGSRDNYGLLNWTVAQDTDDIVYYQSYTHEVRKIQITGAEKRDN